MTSGRLRRAQNIFMPNNINCTIIIITWMKGCNQVSSMNKYAVKSLISFYGKPQTCITISLFFLSPPSTPPGTLFGLLFSLLSNICLKTQKQLYYISKILYMSSVATSCWRKKSIINKNSCLSHHIAHFISGVISVSNLNVLVFDPISQKSLPINIKTSIGINPEFTWLIPIT